MTTFYVDTSHHDRRRRAAPLDWAAIGASMDQAQVMVARATYGDPAGWHRDTAYFGEMQVGARDVGYSWRGGYHNLIRGDAASIARQVDWLRAELDRYGCTWAMCDIEAYDELKTAGLVPRWADIVAWNDRWYAVDDRVCTWYLPRWFYNSHLGGTPDLRYLRGPLIQSSYPDGDGTAQQIYTAAGGDNGTGWDDLYGHRLPDIWQYTSSANVNGATGNTDVNAYRGTVAELTELLGEDMATAAEVWAYMINSPSLGQNKAAADWVKGGEAARREVIELQATVAELQGKVDVLLADVTELQARPPVVAGPVELGPEDLAAVSAAAEHGAEAALDGVKVIATIDTSP